MPALPSPAFSGPARISRPTSAAAQLRAASGNGAAFAPVRRACACAFAPVSSADSPASRSACRGCGPEEAALSPDAAGVAAAAPPSSSGGSSAPSSASVSRRTAGSQPGRSFSLRTVSPSSWRRPSTVSGGRGAGSGAGGRSGRRVSAGLTLRTAVT